MNKLTDPDLDTLLDGWKVNRPVDDGKLAVGVWRRIAVSEAESRRESFWFAWLRNGLCRPGFALAAVIFFSLLGLVLAEARIQQEKTVSVEALEDRYFRAIDPVSMAVHRHRE